MPSHSFRGVCRHPRSMGVFGLHNLKCLLIGGSQAEDPPGQEAAGRPGSRQLSTCPCTDSLCAPPPAGRPAEALRAAGADVALVSLSSCVVDEMDFSPMELDEALRSSRHTSGPKGRLRRWSGSSRRSGWGRGRAWVGVGKRKVPGREAQGLGPNPPSPPPLSRVRWPCPCLGR